MHVVSITAADCRLLAARFAEHGNSYRRMRGALLEAGASPVAKRLDALRRLERQFEVDLGDICYRYQRRGHAGVHPVERMIIGWIVEARSEGEELWVLLDRIHQLRELMEGRLVGEPES